METKQQVTSCHECGSPHHVLELPKHAKAFCHNCKALLYRHIPNSLDKSIALYFTVFLLFLFANTFPFLSLELSGRLEENILISSSLAFYDRGMWELSLLVLFTSIIFPFIVIIGTLYILIPIRLGFEPPGLGLVFRIVNTITPWSLVGVFMLAVLVAIVKLQDIATVLPGISLYTFALLIVIFAVARSNLQLDLVWSLNKHQSPGVDEYNSHQQWLNCHSCKLLLEENPESNHCPRCHAKVHYRKENSIQRTWALIFAAAILIIPANVYPIMTVIRFGQGEPNTIFTGIVYLIEEGLWVLAIIVLFASIIVPVLKLVTLSYLLISVQRKSRKNTLDRTMLYRLTEVVGSWSMVDIYLVGLLCSLVKMDKLASIVPGIGATFFAGVVIITIFAAHSFDPRLIWDKSKS